MNVAEVIAIPIRLFSPSVPLTIYRTLFQEHNNVNIIAANGLATVYVCRGFDHGYIVLVWLLLVIPTTSILQIDSFLVEFVYRRHSTEINSL